MTTDEIYAAAAESVRGYERLSRKTIELILDAVAPLLIAHGRREAAQAIRAERKQIPADQWPGAADYRDALAMAARTAEGPVDGPSVAVEPRPAPGGPGARTDAEAATGDGGT